MGCDGGSIQDCRALIVTLKKNPERISKQTLLEIQWTTCNLSKEPLREPIVADEIGHLYNKEALIHALLEKTISRKHYPHIRTLRDVIPVNFTPNPDYTEDSTKSKYICPITLDEVGGQQKFILLRKCGHVISEKALKEIKSDACGSCGVTFVKETDCILLNPPEDLIEEKKAQLKQRLQEKRMSKKAKESTASTSNNNTTVTTTASDSADPSKTVDAKAEATEIGADNKKPSKKRTHDDASLNSGEQRAKKAIKSDKRTSSPTPTTEGTSAVAPTAAAVAAVAAKTVEQTKQSSAAYSSIFLDKKNKESYQRNDFLVRSGMKGPNVMG